MKLSLIHISMCIRDRLIINITGVLTFLSCSMICCSPAPIKLVGSTSHSTTSVSYTHLDVYKRQAFTGIKLRQRCCKIIFMIIIVIIRRSRNISSIFTTNLLSVFSYCVSTVSYTHLDVYKRQAVYSVLFSIRSYKCKNI